jgi:hypothetical protein
VRERLVAEHDENVCREPFKPSRAVAIGRAIEEQERARAKERQREGGKAGGLLAGKGRPKDEEQASAKLAEASEKPAAEGGETIEKVASAVGMGKETYRKAEAVVRAAEESPELFGDLPQQNLRPINRTVRREQIRLLLTGSGRRSLARHACFPCQCRGGRPRGSRSPFCRPRFAVAALHLAVWGLNC